MYMYNNNKTKLYTWTYERFTFSITSCKEKAEYYLRMTTVTMAMNKHTVSIPKRIPIKHVISQSLKMRESCSATAWSLTRSRPHRLASLWRNLSPSFSPRRSFHGNSRISSGFHGGGQGNISHNASGFEYRCVTNSPSLHSRSALLLHCVKNENNIDKFKKSNAELKKRIIIRPLYMVLNHPESNNIYGAILCLLTSNCNLINKTTWLFCCSYNNERTTIVKWKSMFNRDLWGGGLIKTLIVLISKIYIPAL